MTESERAKKWRERAGLSRAALAELTGYSKEAIYFMERGGTDKQAIQEWTWQRYRRACQAVEAERAGFKFNW